jgi:putative addiction module component (TIGR02574 family)
MSDYTSILSAATQLPVDERLRLIGDLSDSIPEQEVQLSPEWLAEIERRSAEIEAGTVETVDWETVRNDLFRRVGLERGT